MYCCIVYLQRPSVTVPGANLIYLHLIKYKYRSQAQTSLLKKNSYLYSLKFIFGMQNLYFRCTMFSFFLKNRGKRSMRIELFFKYVLWARWGLTHIHGTVTWASTIYLYIIFSSFCFVIVRHVMMNKQKLPHKDFQRINADISHKFYFVKANLHWFLMLLSGQFRPNKLLCVGFGGI